MFTLAAVPSFLEYSGSKSAKLKHVSNKNRLPLSCLAFIASALSSKVFYKWFPTAVQKKEQHFANV